MITNPEENTVSPLELDLNKISSVDFDTYELDLNRDPFVKYGEMVLQGDEVVDDVQFALLDLAWKVRLDDAFQLGLLTVEVDKMVEKKGKRFGFVFAHTLLNSCHAIQELDYNQEPGQKMFIGSSESKSFSLTEKLQDYAVGLIEDYLLSIETVNDDNQGQIKSDIDALGFTVGRSLGDLKDWLPRVEEKRESKKRVGDGYLDMNHCIELLAVINDFRKKESISEYTEIEVNLDNLLRHKEELKTVGIDIDAELI